MMPSRVAVTSSNSLRTLVTAARNSVCKSRQRLCWLECVGDARNLAGCAHAERHAAANDHEIARTLAGWESAETIMGPSSQRLVFGRTSTSLATSFLVKNATSATIAFLAAINGPSLASLITSALCASRAAGITSRAPLSLVASTRTTARSSTSFVVKNGSKARFRMSGGDCRALADHPMELGQTKVAGKVV